MSTFGHEVEGSPELISKDREARRQEGWDRLVTIIRVAKAGGSWKKDLDALKPFINEFQDIQAMINQMVKNLDR